MRHHRHNRHDKASPTYHKVKFYRHLRSYIMVWVILLSITLLGRGLHMNMGWVTGMLFWGVGLLAHYMSVFGLPGTGGVLGKEWEQRLLEKENPRPHDDDEHLDLKPLKPRQKAWDDKDLV